MIGIILAAGKGSRLGKYTSDLPKSLLRLNQNQTLLDYNIDILNKLKVDRILIVTGFSSEKIEAHVSGKNISCIYNPFWNCCNVLGSLYMALPYIDDDFLFLHADTLVDFEVWRNLYDYDGDIVMPYIIKDCGEEEMKVKLDLKGQILEVNKTMDSSVANGEFLGIAKFSHEMVNYVFEVSKLLFKKGRLDYYMEAAVEWAIQDGKDIQGFDIGSAKFIEVDFEEDYIQAQATFS